MQNPGDQYQGWDIPQRQSAAAIFILLLKAGIEILKSLWPAILILFFKDKKDDSANNTILIAVSGFIILSFIIAFIRYWFYRFHINQNNLVIQSGWIKKKTLTVPLHNIQEVHFEQNLWQRILNVVAITIDSAGSEKSEAKISALSHKKAEELKVLLLSHSGTPSELAIEENKKKKRVSRLSNGDLFRFSLTANHLEAFVIIISLSLNVLEDLKDALKIDSWGWMQDNAKEIAGQTTYVIAGLVIIVAFISVIVSIIRTILKYYDFTIEDTARGWKLSHGLINKQQKIVPANKIQILTWKANWVRRKFNLWILHVMSIGNSAAARSQRIQIPVTSLLKVLSLTPVYQSSPVFDPIDGSGIASDYWKRKTLFAGIPTTVFLLLIFYFWLGTAGIWVSLLILYFTCYYYLWYKRFRWQINEEGLQLYSGVWGRKFSLLTWKKIQHVQMSQTPYQRTRDLASILFITAGGNLKIPYIPLEKATTLTNLSLFYVESRNEHWM